MPFQDKRWEKGGKLLIAEKLDLHSVSALYVAAINFKDK